MNKQRSVTHIEILPYNIQKIWMVITDNTTYTWRSDIDEIKILDATNFVEVGKGGYELAFTITKKVEPVHYEFLIKGSVYEGVWSGRLESVSEDQTKLVFTENIVFKSIFFKWLSYFMINLTKMQQTYFSDLKKELQRKNIK